MSGTLEPYLKVCLCWECCRCIIATLLNMLAMLGTFGALVLMPSLRKGNTRAWLMVTMWALLDLLAMTVVFMGPPHTTFVANYYKHLAIPCFSEVFYAVFLQVGRECREYSWGIVWRMLSPILVLFPQGGDACYHYERLCCMSITYGIYMQCIHVSLVVNS